MNNTAILITYDKEDAMKEAVSQCNSAGYDVFKIINQKYLNHPKFGLGEGKVDELNNLVQSSRPDVIIFDEVLKPSQNYNLASKLKINILDREALILQIFENIISSRVT